MSGAIEIFIKGGPIMWPILVLSIITVTVIAERVLFLTLEALRQRPGVVAKMFEAIEHWRPDDAITIAAQCDDSVARVLRYGLEHRDVSLTNALIEASSKELDRYNRGLVVLDTAVTLGPLLGLLGTVVGMISAFGIVGEADMAGQQAAITGGIAESLIAVTFGLAVAIAAIIPLNFLNAHLDKVRRRLEENTTHIELLLLRQSGQNSASDKSSEKECDKIEHRARE